jgi:hypothetical protein
MSGVAILTPSYAADFTRCQLLCDSMDALAEGAWRHYILVADHDLALFKALEGPRRVVITDGALLPSWMKAVKRPFDRQGRHIWISGDIRRQIRPLSGWHVQQLRKLSAAANVVDEDTIVMADSDSVFVRPFGIGQFRHGDEVRLYRKPGAIVETSANRYKHSAWVRHAAEALGLPAPTFPADDYINNLVSWRKDRVRELLARIEATSGHCFALALGRAPTLSEYQLYGAFVDGVAGMAGHFASADALSHTYWSGEALDSRRLDSFMSELKPHQVALCVQSFTGTPLELLRKLLRFSDEPSAPTKSC